ncbi:helix-turn-helix domain-containing protein [Ethanoligenens sp.]|uniref:helix-turn-helix domain-containing protein n=1 Tax=Ethanoligenens sp. TaxID=2099655 RepID=UPI0039ED3FC7
MMKQTLRGQRILAVDMTEMGRNNPNPTKDIAKYLGQEIQYRRKQVGYTQTALAQKIGKGLRIVQKYEKGEIVPSLSVLAAISDALEIPLNLLTNQHSNDAMEVPIGNMVYEIEQDAQNIRIYRQIPDEEYQQWYTGDKNISRRGEIRRLFLIEVPLAQAAEMLVHLLIFPHSKTDKE